MKEIKKKKKLNELLFILNNIQHVTCDSKLMLSELKLKNYQNCIRCKIMSQGLNFP